MSICGEDSEPAFQVYMNFLDLIEQINEHLLLITLHLLLITLGDSCSGSDEDLGLGCDRHLQMQQQLAPIWDAIDEEQWTYALQLIEKAQKRYRAPSKTMLGLQGLCLVKGRRVSEAIEVCETIRLLAPTSSDSYQTIHDIFRTSPSQGASEYLVATMETGFRETKSEVMGRLWFMEAVRTGQLQAQRKAAIELQKGFLARDYFYLVVISMFLLHQRSEGKDKQLLGMLMERMIQKAADNVSLEDSAADGSPSSGPRIDTPEEFYLFVDIMRTMGHSDTVLKALSGPHGKKFGMNHEFLLLKLELLVSVEGIRSNNIRQICRQSIEAGTDDWTVYKAYVDSIHLEDDALRTESSELLTSVAVSRSTRNSKLAKVYLAARQSTDEPGNLVAELTAYFEAFSDKLATYEDLAPFACSLKHEHQRSFMDAISSHKSATSIGDIIAVTNLTKIKILLASEPIAQTGQLNDQLQLLTTSLLTYSESLKLGGELKETDNQYGDDLLLIAAQQSANIASQGHLPGLRQVIVLLEYALTKSKHNFQFHLLLIKLYKRLGAWSLAQKHFSALSIKHIQRDTLSHVLLQSSTLEYISPLQVTTLKESQNIYFANQVETPDIICQAYEHRTYSKISEFLKYQERLAKSVWWIESNIGIWEIQILLDKFAWQTKIDTSVLNGPVYDNKSHDVLLDIQASANVAKPEQKQEKLISEDELVMLKRSMLRLQRMQAIVRNDKSLVTIPESEIPTTVDSTDEDKSHTLVDILFTAKFNQHNSNLETLPGLINSLHVSHTASTDFTITQLKENGTLANFLKTFAVLLPSLKSLKHLPPIVKSLSTLPTTLKSELEQLRRSLASTCSPIERDLLDLIHVDSDVREEWERKIRLSQSESVNCLLGVLKGISNL